MHERGVENGQRAPDAQEPPVHGTPVLEQDLRDDHRGVVDRFFVVRQAFNEGPRGPRAQSAYELVLDRFDVDDRQFSAQEQRQVGGFRVVSSGQRAEKEVELGEVLALGEAAGAEVQQRDPAVPQEHDVPGVQIAVIEVVLEELPQERVNEPPGEPLRVDPVFLEPVCEPLRVGRAQLDEVAHQRRGDELGDQHARRRVVGEHLGDGDFPARQVAAHALDGGRLEAEIGLLARNLLEFLDGALPADGPIDAEPGEHADGHPHDPQIAGKGAGDARPLNLDGHPHTLASQPGAMQLADPRHGKRSLFERVEDVVDRSDLGFERRPHDRKWSGGPPRLQGAQLTTELRREEIDAQGQ